MDRRGQCDRGGSVLERINVRRYGPVGLRFGPDEPTEELLERLGNDLPSADDAFARRLPTRGAAD